MNIIKEYNLRDFTRDHYREILRSSLKKYDFRTYTDFKESKRCILLRHDVDASVPSALEIAKIEKDLGVKASYFILLHSPWYNLLEREQSDCVKKIIRLGHHIGLHFDTGYYAIKTERELNKYLKLEKEFLEQLFETKIEAFAFHNPDLQSLKFDKWKYAGMINTYAGFFRKNAGYISDSNGYWRHNRLIDEIKNEKHKILQILTHPLHWQVEAGYPKHKVWRYISDTADKSLKNYDKFLLRHNRLNIGELAGLFEKIKAIDNESKFRIEKFWIEQDYNYAFLTLWISQRRFLKKCIKKSGYDKLNILKEKILKNEIRLKHAEAQKAMTGLAVIINEIK